MDLLQINLHMSAKMEARLCKEIMGISFLRQKKKHKKELKNLRGKKMEKQELQTIIKNHKKWLNNEPSGKMADLSGADLSGADLSGANLSMADLSDISYNENTAFYAMVCPEKGSFIGYKKASGKIIELMITENAKRSSATTRKCRCSEAVVLSITNVDGTNFDGEKVVSDYDKSFVYEVGKTISVDNFNDNRWEECAAGIHFFITRDEAVRY